MRQRIAASIILVPIGIAVIYYGGIFFVTLISALLVLAAREYLQLFRGGGSQPSSVIVLGGTLAFSALQAINLFTESQRFNDASWLAATILLISITYHLVQFERGREQAATDFAVTISAVF